MGKLIWLLSALVLIGCTQTESYQEDGEQEGGGPYSGTVGEEILAAHAVARVDLLGQTTDVGRAIGPYGWEARLEFRFRVHEYLKGSGPNEIVGEVSQMHFETQAQARAYLPTLVSSHDTRWDNRQALLFMYSSRADNDSRVGNDEGRFVIGYPDSYLVTSLSRKRWLPAAEPGEQRSANPNPRFLLDAPHPGSATRSGTRAASSDSSPTITLNAVKELITDLEAKAAMSKLHRECLDINLREPRRIAERAKLFGTAVRSVTYRGIESGLPADTEIWRGPGLAVTSTLYTGRQWFEGPDAEHFKFKAKDFKVPDGTADFVNFKQTIVTARPLPAGEYRFFFNSTPSFMALCTDSTPEEQKNLEDGSLTITAPWNTAHEAFFDPVAIGDAVGADSANGVLNPAAFSLDGAKTTIESLKWENGTVTMELNPTASLADYTLDFIDVTGTTTLSLSSVNASTTALTWTVPDKPWSDGDLLMLRIRRFVSSDATLSGLALTGIDLAFSPATTTYIATVPATTTQTTVTPTANHGSATYVVKLAGVVDNDGTIDLAVGDNVITVVVTAEDTTTTKTYTVTVTRAAPTEPITVTLSPRVDGPVTYVNITIEWNDPQPCDGEYMVALYTSSDYLVSFLGFHPAPETTSLSRESGWWWDFGSFPDYWAGVRCDPSDYSGSRELGKVSLRAAHPDNN